ncbi:HTH-type transcriptional activator RhaS [Fundidesulfovibrio magnetotacticus]|uniref:HTH-type transcriptional activator RhaS n=1 Tax=Fundidesulfovibrio magnetotacticus TaxID=2730080 RepID=A0A6V8LS63_9BACT|nr:AraC family transcriptional regulator [Fundidesulfovibrio magnetotacticus]GFK95312.1 HTH-type transcriptional activator RhaS [Fundidesulfovibrio magnetotacticus]
MSDTDAERIQRANRLLKEKLLARMPGQGVYETAVEGLRLSRREEPHKVENCFSEPIAAVIVQGFKRSVLGSEEYRYGENQCLVAGVDMPSSSCVLDATRDRPFLAVALVLDKGLITRLAAETPAPQESTTIRNKGISIDNVDPDVLEAFLRLVELLDKPGQIPVLAPLIVREIHYRLLLGPQGAHLRGINTLGSQGNQIAKAINWLKSNYREPLQVDSLARLVNMATSTFHRHFKEVTTLSPLQFHKRLRLYEAQRLMLAERETAAGAALAVGYESPAQFSREYKRLFGEPPHRDIMRGR